MADSPVQEIEITPEMIEAGVAAYTDWDMSDDYSLGNLVASIYRSMRTLARLAHNVDGPPCARSHNGDRPDPRG